MIKRILVPVDFSEPSLQALDEAHEFGAPHKAELVVLHVVQPVYFATLNGYGAGYDAGILLRELERSGREQLSRLAARLQKQRVTVRTLQRVGIPHQVIVETAKKLGCDMIVMATHGRSGLSRVMMGSVAERVVRTAACPVLVVRAEKRSRRPKRGQPRKAAPSRRAGHPHLRAV